MSYSSSWMRGLSPAMRQKSKICQQQLLGGQTVQHLIQIGGARKASRKDVALNYSNLGPRWDVSRTLREGCVCSSHWYIPWNCSHTDSEQWIYYFIFCHSSRNSRQYTNHTSFLVCVCLCVCVCVHDCVLWIISATNSSGMGHMASIRKK